MSDRARDVVRYLKALEDGPVYTTRYGPQSDHRGMPPAYMIASADTAKARMLDAMDPLENALAAVRLYNQKYRRVAT